MNILLYLAEVLLVAYLSKVIAVRLRFPAVSGYLIGGVILGGSLFFWHPSLLILLDEIFLSPPVLAQLDIITQIGLGIIAFSIGVELGWSTLKRLGKSIIYTSLLGAFLPAVLVAVVIWIISRNISLALILGVIASATAPVATISVIQQFKASGPLTRSIIAVAGLDDAISFILFVFILAIVKHLMIGDPLNYVTVLIYPAIEVSVSILIGMTAGIVAAYILIRTHEQENTIFIVTALILGVSGTAALLNVSELLANMAAGVTIRNIYPVLEKRIRLSLSSFTPIILALFFVIGGAYLDITRVVLIWQIALAFLIFRSTGKIAGATIGAVAGNASSHVKKWLGISLLPQLGASTALALAVEHEFGFGEYGAAGIELAFITINTVLITTFFTEFIGPYFTKISLFKSGEAHKESAQIEER